MTLGPLAEPLAIARPLSWIVVVGFLAAGLLVERDRDRARQIALVTWVLFGLFWLVLVPHFVLEKKSIVQGVGAVAAVPLSMYAGYVLWNGRDSLFVLTRAVGVMGLLYLPFAYLPIVPDNPARRILIETVAGQTHAILGAFGIEPQLVQGTEYLSNPGATEDYSYRSTLLFEGNTRPIALTVIIACTGIGSMSIFGGAILAVTAPLGRKVRALAIALPVIYLLNLVRTVFIAAMFGEQYMQWFVGPVMSVFGLTDPQLVSYYISDRILAQFGSVIALVVVTWLVVRELPEILTIVEDLVYLLTRRELDLAGAFGVDVEQGPVETSAGTSD